MSPPLAACALLQAGLGAALAGRTTGRQAGKGKHALRKGWAAGNEEESTMPRRP